MPATWTDERTNGQGGDAGAGFSPADTKRLVERMPDVVFRSRTNPPTLDYVNRAVTRLTGFSVDELYGDPAPLLKLVYKDDRAIVQDLLRRGVGRAPIALRWVRKDGSLIWVEQHCTPLFDDARNLVAIEGVAREIGDPTLVSRPNVRILGDLRIDLDRARVLVGGHDVHLTISEFRLLVLLTDRPGRAVSRAAIMETLWNSSHAGNGRTSEVHVSKLRAKIETDSHHPVRIETIRGTGYRFILSA